MKSIPCKTCEGGILKERQIYRMTPTVVIIGWLLLIPSLLGIFLSFVTLLGSCGAAGGVMVKLSEQVEGKLRARGVSDTLAVRIGKGERVSEADLVGLNSDQRLAVRSAELELSAGTAGAGLGGAMAGTASVCMGIASFIGGLFGWLLVMKKRVLQCHQCSAVVAAS